MAIVQPDGVFYCQLKANDVKMLVEEHLLKGRPVKKLMYLPPEAQQPVPALKDIPFFSKQLLVVLRNRGLMDPEKIDDYIAHDGYVALSTSRSESFSMTVAESIVSGTPVVASRIPAHNRLLQANDHQDSVGTRAAVRRDRRDQAAENGQERREPGEDAEHGRDEGPRSAGADDERGDRGRTAESAGGSGA